MARSWPTTRRRRFLAKSSASGDCIVVSRTIWLRSSRGSQRRAGRKPRLSKKVFPTGDFEGRSATGDSAMLLVMLFLPLGSNGSIPFRPAAYAERRSKQSSIREKGSDEGRVTKPDSPTLAESHRFCAGY